MGIEHHEVLHMVLEVKMYQPKDKSYAVIAVIFYLIYWFGLFGAGILYQNGIQSGMNIIYCVLFILGILIVLVKDKKINNLGFYKGNRKKNLIVATIIVSALCLLYLLLYHVIAVINAIITCLVSRIVHLWVHLPVYLVLSWICY